MTPLRILSSTALAFALAVPALPAFSAMPGSAGGFATFLPDGADALVIDVKQGRSGTGQRGRDRDRDDDDDDDNRGRGRGGHRDDDDRSGRGGDDAGSGSGRDKPRIPGGSGCDDPGDILEHPECRVGGGFNGAPPKDDVSGSGRDKPRIPGGSGCDDPEDLIEHPECRL